ncbi:GNAT family acetyltransferase [Penicillium citrinum]|uniref:GNAT family acetyltransferase n=1 Tax=Penicillium citrinum TaxID=5077 RepID=A0A9W9TTD0_PENCI|nr:GNAT family acetyltransferase [Penicillium citrinum]KAJ5240502.1 GNAT family acetyltransferase [Penicillium citrinum]
MPASTKISYHPVSSEDAPVLARIHCDAFADDILMDLMYGDHHSDLKNITKDLSDTIIADSTARFVKAVDDKSGELVGWSWWNIYHNSETHLAAAAAAKDLAPPNTAISPEAFLEYHRATHAKREKWLSGRPVACKLCPHPGSLPYSSSVVPMLLGKIGIVREMGKAALQKRVHSVRIISLTLEIVLQVLVVRPTYQSQGIGTQLVKIGIPEIEALGLPAWVEASSKGSRIYEHCGFRDLEDYVDIDLAKYGGNGIRRGVCMLRNPSKQTSRIRG